MLGNHEHKSMIPTEYKSKISNKLSWPLGTEKLSEAFEGLSQFSDFTLWFSGYDQSKVSTKNEIPVISIEYSFIRLGCGSPKWRIRIYPVPREFKHRIKELMDQGFPQLREWCLSHHGITGNEGSEANALL